MKSQIFQRFLITFRKPYHLTRLDLLFTLLPALTWLGGVYARPLLIDPRCNTAPQTCTHQSVFTLDQVAIGNNYPNADLYSYYTQNLSGALLFLLPLIWHFARGALGRLPLLAMWPAIGTDLILGLQTTAWNGMINELVRLIVQRPRPFVYADITQGVDPANYTSFYSGHTSFATSAGVALLLILLGRQAPTNLIRAASLAVFILIASTAALRVLAGRHFVTDVLTAIVAGSVVASLVAFFHRPKAC